MRLSHYLPRRLFRLLPLDALERLAPRKVIVFCYHVVSDKPISHVRHLYEHKGTAEFEADLLYLTKRYHLPTWPELLKNLSDRHFPQHPCALVTFDDGMSQCFDVVRPLLLKHRVPGVFFVCKDFVDNRSMFYRHKVSLCLEKLLCASASNQSALLQILGHAFGVQEFSLEGFSNWIKQLERVNESSIDQACALLGIDIEAELQGGKPYLTSDQIRQLAADGFIIGGHSLRHEHFWLLGESALARNIVESCEFVTHLTGTAQSPFAFPFGSGSINRSFLAGIRERHRSVGLLFDTAGILTDAPFVVNRILADSPAGGPAGHSGVKWLTKAAYVENLCS